jgi:hypothetical protein
VTGQATLVVDLDASGFRFFALDVNPADGLLYGYTEYGSPTGLYSIDPESGVTTFIAAPIPASNSSARALAIGNDTIYLAATRGDDGVPLYAWDLGTGGPWVPFDNPYPEYHSTGGAAWIPSPSSGIETGSVAEPAGPQIEWVAPNPVLGSAQISWRLAAEGPARLEVIDVAGRFVAQLETGRRGAGSHVTHWDGRGDQGRLLPSGTYFVRLTAESGVSTTPVLLIR